MNTTQYIPMFSYYFSFSIYYTLTFFLSSFLSFFKFINIFLTPLYHHHLTTPPPHHHLTTLPPPISYTLLNIKYQIKVANLGVTGPLDINNDKIFTHSFVHRTHIDVFGHLFPPSFKNWWSDDWISTVYGPEHTFR